MTETNKVKRLIFQSAYLNSMDWLYHEMDFYRLVIVDGKRTRNLKGGESLVILELKNPDNKKSLRNRKMWLENAMKKASGTSAVSLSSCKKQSELNLHLNLLRTSNHRPVSFSKPFTASISCWLHPLVMRV